MTEQVEYPRGAEYPFDVRPFLDVVQTLCNADEFERALLVLDNLPAYYRDNPPEEVTRMRQVILENFMTVQDYIENPHDQPCPSDRAAIALAAFHRGKMVFEDIKALNEAGYVPHVVDMGPGDYWMPQAMKAQGAKFIYQPLVLQQAAKEMAKRVLGDIVTTENPRKGDRPILFCAHEVIEHLKDVRDITHLFAKVGGYADKIYLSTPYYTYGSGAADWYDPKHRGFLGHWRAYTPTEFLHTVTRLFPNYVLELSLAEVMIIRGIHQELYDADQTPKPA